MNGRAKECMRVGVLVITALTVAVMSQLLVGCGQPRPAPPANNSTSTTATTAADAPTAPQPATNSSGKYMI